MLGAIRFEVDRQCLAIKGLGLGKLALIPEREGEVVQRERHTFVRATDLFAAYLQRFASQRLGLNQIASLAYDGREVIKYAGYVGVLVAQELPSHRQGLAAHRFGVGKV